MNIIKKIIDGANFIELGYHILISDGIKIQREVHICSFLDCKASEYIIANSEISAHQTVCLYDNMHEGNPNKFYWIGDTEISGELPSRQELVDYNNTGYRVLSGDINTSVPFIYINETDTVVDIIKKFNDVDIFIKKENII